MIVRFRLRDIVKAFAFSTIVGALMLELYVQVVIVRLFSRGTTALIDPGEGSREATMLEQAFWTIASIRYSVPNALVVAAFTVAAVASIYIFFERARSRSVMLLMAVGGMMGGAIGVAIVAVMYGRYADSTCGIVFGAVAAGAFAAGYLRSKVVEVR